MFKSQTLSKQDIEYFKESVNSTAKTLHPLIKYSGDSIALFVTFDLRDETKEENNFVDLSEIHIRNIVPKPEVASFPYIYTSEDYYGKLEGIALLQNGMPDDLNEPILEVQSTICNTWDTFAKEQTSLTLTNYVIYVVEDVMEFTKSGIWVLGTHDLRHVRYPYSSMKNEIIRKNLQALVEMHRESIRNGKIPHYTVN